MIGRLTRSDLEFGRKALTRYYCIPPGVTQVSLSPDTWHLRPEIVAVRDVELGESRYFGGGTGASRSFSCGAAVIESQLGACGTGER